MNYIETELFYDGESNLDKERERYLLKAIEKLGKDIKLVFIALEITNLSSPPTSLNRGIYTEEDFMKDLILYLPQKFPGLRDKKIGALWKRFIKLIYEGGRFDIFKEFPEFWYKVYRKHYSLILKEIQDQIKLLKPQEKLGLYLFLKNMDLFQVDFTREKLNSILTKRFSEVSESIPNNIGEILVRTGLLFESSYINTQRKPLGFSYQVANYLKELDQILITEFRKDKTISDYIKKLDLGQSKQISEKICTLCGAFIPIGAIHCSECGNKV